MHLTTKEMILPRHVPTSSDKLPHLPCIDATVPHHALVPDSDLNLRRVQQLETRLLSFR